MSTTPLLDMDEMAVNQASKYITFNEAIKLLEAIAVGKVISRTITAEPTSPSDGDMYIIPASATGTTWSTYAENDVALYRGSAWVNVTPVEGFGPFWVNDENVNVNFDGSAWSDALSSSGIIAGDPGTEGSGINVGGVTYDSVLKVSDIGGSKVAQSILHRHSTTLQPLMVGARSNSDTSSHAAVTNSQALFSLYAAGRAASQYNLFAEINLGVDASGTISDTSAPGRISLRTSADGSVTPTERLAISNSGKVSTGGETAPDVDSGGLCVHQSGTSANAISVKSTSMTTHPFTSIAENDTYFGIKSVMSGGGALLAGFSADYRALYFQGLAKFVNTSDTGFGVVNLDSRKTDGGTSYTALASNENLLSVTNSNSIKAVVKGNGDIVTQGGIRLSGGSSLLGTYEEGSWTPDVADASTGGNSATITVNSATYRRIGKQVTVSFNISGIDTTGMTAGNVVYIKGLPYAAAASNHVASGTIRMENISFSGVPNASTSPSATSLYIAKTNSGGANTYTHVSDLTSGSANLFGTITYFVD